jgi:hypothetical protein
VDFLVAAGLLSAKAAIQLTLRILPAGFYTLASYLLRDIMFIGRLATLSRVVYCSVVRSVLRLGSLWLTLARHGETPLEGKGCPALACYVTRGHVTTVEGGRRPM